MKSLSEGIQKAMYTRTWFNPSKLQLGYKVTYEIFSDGKVVRRYYEGTSRKASETVKWTIDSDKIKALFDEIADCIHDANQVEGYVDDCGAQLKLYFWDGEVELPRGFGTREKDIGQIMETFANALPRE